LLVALAVEVVLVAAGVQVGLELELLLP